VLLTFDSETAMRAVIGRVRDDRQFAAAEPYFAFNTLARVKQDARLGSITADARGRFSRDR
jgi:hypothetical protein